MPYKNVKAPGKQIRGRVHEMVSKPGVEDPAKDTTKREQFLTLLKKQYGYTNEKAIDELERLLKQFYKMNKSLGIRRSRPDFKHPQTIN